MTTTIMSNLPQNNKQELSGKPPLESFALHEDGQLYWWASWYAKVLGYKSLSTLSNAIQKAKDTCIALNIDINKNLISVQRKEDSYTGQDFKLSKFFCFLVAIHADTRKPVVKRARLYFLNELEELHIHLDQDDYFERRSLRDSIRESSSDLNKAARRARVKDIRNFINEGYLGLYNRPIQETKKRRGIPENEDIYDYMGMTELSANLFRIALTEERLKKLRNPSQEKAQLTHWKISSQIRSMITEHGGNYPEMLSFEKSLEKIEKSLKKAQKLLNASIKKSAKELHFPNKEKS
jgi:DNA-damage-inducible protein D